MRIGFLNGYSIWGGGEKWHYEMASYCKDKGDKVFFFGPQDGELFKRLQNQDIECHNVEINKASYYNPLFFFKLKSLIKKHKIDVLVFNSFVDVRACAIAVKSAGVKKVILRCGMPIAPKESFSYKLAFSKGIDYFMGISQAVVDEFKMSSPSLLRESQYAGFIPNGIDLEIFSYSQYTPHDGPVVLGNASRLSHQKGLDMLANSLTILKERGINFKMKIAGTGEEEHKLKKLYADLGLHNHVEFLGHLDDVASFVKEIDIYAFTSRYEGTARSMIESMAMGIPVVAFNTSSMKEVIIDRDSGLLAQAFNEEDFANKLQQLIEDQELCKEISLKGKERVENLFNKKKNFSAWYEFLSKEN